MSVTAPATRRESQPGDIDTPTSRLAARPADAEASVNAEAPVNAEALERDQLLDRLRSLRRVLPALAQEMAAARRQAARLRTDNRRLAEQVRQLRATLEAREHRRA